jgi:hypothetical protein
MRIQFGDHELEVGRSSAGGKSYWVVYGPKILRGGRMDPQQRASYGTIQDDGKIHSWGGRGEAGRHYQYALEEALKALVREGKARDVAGEKKAQKDRAEEEKTGSFIVKVSNGKQSRFHDFAKANRWAEEIVKAGPIGTRAEFFRAGVGDRKTWSDGRPLTGIPWTEPFHVIDKDEHGRVGMSSGKPRAASFGNYVSSRPWVVYRRSLSVPSLVGRYKNSVRAHEVAREENAFCKHITTIDPSLKKVLGLRG